MARFVMARKLAARIAARQRPEEHFNLLDALGPLEGRLKVISGDDPWSKTEDQIILFDADPNQVNSKKFDGRVWIEPEIFHWPQPSPSLGQREDRGSTELDYVVRVVCAGQPIEGA